MFDKKVTLRVGDESMVFDLSESMKHPKESDDELYFVEGVENLDEVEVFDHLGTAGIIQPYGKLPYSRMQKSDMMAHFVVNAIRPYGFFPYSRILPDHSIQPYSVLPYSRMVNVTEPVQTSSFTIRPYGDFPYSRMPYLIEESDIESMEPFYFDMGG